MDRIETPTDARPDSRAAGSTHPPVPPARRTAAVVAAALLGAVVLFQLALIAGAPWGALTQGGQVTGALPVSGRVVAAMSAILLVLMSLGLLAAAGIGPLTRAPRRVIGALLWFTTIYSGLGVLMNAASPSRAETLMWVPVTLIGFVLSVVVLRQWRARPASYS